MEKTHHFALTTEYMENTWGGEKELGRGSCAENITSHTFLGGGGGWGDGTQ